MQRLYFPSLDINDTSIVIKNKSILNQLIKVLRLKIGTQLVFFNGIDDIDLIFEIKEIQKKEIYLEFIEIIENTSEINFDLTLFQSLPNKLDKIEYVLQKGVEIGVTGFYFFKSERSQKLNLSENKIERLNKIIIEAVEQSGRSRIPELVIEDHINLEDIENSENIFFHTKGGNSNNLKDLNLNYTKAVNLFIGPEGGFSDQEIEIFTKNKFKKVCLGNRILRTETVGIVSGFYIIHNK